MRRQREDVVPGEWFDFAQDQQIVCCDCGLVHIWQVRKRRGRFQLRCWRDDRSTGATRRYGDFVMSKHG